MKDGYKDVSDLYARGDVLVLMNGKQVWVQALNSFEMEECRTAARVARARLVNVLRQPDSDEAQVVRAQFRDGRREEAIRNLVDSRQDEITLKISMEIDADPEWQEVIDLVSRSKDIASRGPTEEEAKALEESSHKYVAFINRRVQEETDLLTKEMEALDDQQLEDAILDNYIRREGDRIAMDEYRLAEMALAARTCDAEMDDNGTWVHKIPVSQREPIWDRKEMRSLPEQLQQEIQLVLRTLNMPAQTAKDSAAPASSSDSSVPPNEEEASQPSTPEATSSSPPGT